MKPLRIKFNELSDFKHRIMVNEGDEEYFDGIEIRDVNNQGILIL